MIETDFLDTLLAAFRWRFEARLSGHLLRGYLTGSAQMVQYGQTKLGRPIYFEGPPMQEAIRFAQRRAAASVKTIEPKFKEDLRKMIVEGIQERKGVDTIRREISKHFEGLEKYQADRIARTETANALQEGSMERGRAMGVTGKEWVVTPYGEWPCDDCEAAEAAGVIPMDQDFPGGVSHPPMHPNCACAIAYAMLPEKGD